MGSSPRFRIVFIVAFLVIFSSSAASALAGSRGSFNVILGGKALTEEDWAGLDRADELVFDVSWGDDRWPILINTYLALASAQRDSSVYSIQGDVAELGIGIRKEWGVGRVHPYVGGGFVFASGDIDGRPGVPVDDIEGGGGLWLSAGASFRIVERLNLGAGFRFSAVAGEIDRLDTDLGGASVGLLLGWAWPASP
jgi:hypothetical protein